MSNINQIKVQLSLCLAEFNARNGGGVYVRLKDCQDNHSVHLEEHDAQRIVDTIQIMQEKNA